MSTKLEHLKEKAFQGDHLAQLELGLELAFGRRTMPNMELAEQWLRQSAKADNKNAGFYLGLFLFQQKRHKQAERWMRKSLEAGHPEAAYALWYLHEHSTKEKSNREQRDLLRKGIELGSIFSLHQFVLDGNYPLFPDWQNKSLHLLENHPTGQLLLQRAFEEAEDGHFEDHMHKAASFGHPEAQYLLSLFYRTENNLVQSRYWLEQAAKFGHKRAKIGVCLLNMEKGEVDGAVQELERLASQNVVEAQRVLGEHYGKKDDFLQAFPYLYRAMKADDEMATMLFYRYFPKFIRLEKRTPLVQKFIIYSPVVLSGVFAVLFWTHALNLLLAAHYQNPFLYISLGMAIWLTWMVLYWQKPKLQSLIPSIPGTIKKAEKGDSEAQYQVSQWFKKGTNGQVKDLSISLKWLKKSAEQGHVMACTELGEALYGQQDVIKVSQAVTLWRRAAEMNHPQAQYLLAKHLLQVTTAESSIIEDIFALLTSAADNGVSDANIEIGWLHLRKQLQNSNPTEAADYFLRALSGSRIKEAYWGLSETGCYSKSLKEVFFLWEAAQSLHGLALYDLLSRLPTFQGFRIDASWGGFYTDGPIQKQVNRCFSDLGRYSSTTLQLLVQKVGVDMIVKACYRAPEEVLLAFDKHCFKAMPELFGEKLQSMENTEGVDQVSVWHARLALLSALHELYDDGVVAVNKEGDRNTDFAQIVEMRFEELLHLDRKGARYLLGKVKREVWLYALRFTTKDVQKHLLSFVSSKKRKDFEAEISVLAIHRTEAELAQEIILTECYQAMVSGSISMHSKTQKSVSDLVFAELHRVYESTAIIGVWRRIPRSHRTPLFWQLSFSQRDSLAVLLDEENQKPDTLNDDSVQEPKSSFIYEFIELVEEGRIELTEKVAELLRVFQFETNEFVYLTANKIGMLIADWSDAEVLCLLSTTEEKVFLHAISGLPTMRQSALRKAYEESHFYPDWSVQRQHKKLFLMLRTLGQKGLLNDLPCMQWMTKMADEKQQVDSIS